MYADTFLTLEEFKEMFDLTQYEIVRKKYHAEGSNQSINQFLVFWVGYWECIFL